MPEREYIVVLRVKTATGHPRTWDWPSLIDEADVTLVTADKVNEYEPGEENDAAMEDGG